MGKHLSRPEYRFCPYCGTPLDRIEAHGRVRPVCTACGYIQFHDPKVAVIALVVAQKRLLLVRRGVEPEWGKWALPGGFVDAGEMPADALARELTEEVGLSVCVDGLIGIYPMEPTNRSAGGIVLAYRACVGDDGAPELTIRDDALDARWFLPDELPENLAFESTTRLVSEWRASHGARPEAAN